VDDLGAEAEAQGLGLEEEHVGFRVDFQGDFGLAEAFPAGEEGVRMGGRGAEEGFVAG